MILPPTIVTGSVIVPDDLAANHHRVGGAHVDHVHRRPVEPPTLRTFNIGIATRCHIGTAVLTKSQQFLETV